MRRAMSLHVTAIALGLVTAVLACWSAPAVAADPRPNVLWIYLEDVSGWFSCSGEKLIQTPHIDRLVAEGTRFTRFYTSAGVCSATRSAVMLGAMQTTFGVHHHRSSRNNAKGTKHDGIGMIHLPEGVVPLPQWCRQHGAFTFNDGRLKDDFNFVFRHEDFYDYCPDEKGWGLPHTVAGDCWRDRKQGQPFFGQVQLAGGKYGLGRSETPPRRVVDRAAVPVPPYYPDIPEVREEIGRHYDCLVKTDEQVGEILAALDRDGLADSTVVILFSDHGYCLHRHKQFIYEGGIRMPLIVAGPGIPRGAVRDDLVSSIDVAPTTLGILGLPIPRHMEGRDVFAAGHVPREFVVAARDRCDYTIERIRAVVTKKHKYLRNYLTDRPYMQPSYKDPWPVSIRLREMMENGEMNDAQKIFFGDSKPAEEFYDLENDPHEIVNLAADPAHAAALERHRKLLADWIAATGDKGQVPEDDAGLIQVLYEWGDKCVNPEYDRLRGLIEPRRPKPRLPKPPTAAGGPAAAAAKPNVIVLLVDDLGYADLGVQGSGEIPTPHIDALARSGVRCTNGYVSHPFCSPTRAGLLTGRQQQRFGHEFNPVYDPLDPAEGLPLTERTLPEVLRSGGYRTAWVGKWHLGASPRHLAAARGFTDTFGFVGGGHRFRDWKPDGRQYTLPIERAGVGVDVPGHLTAALGDEAAAFIRRAAGSPWFLYLAFNAPHTPHEPTPGRLERFAGIADRNRRAYAAQVSLLDDAIGTVTAALAATGQSDDTLIFFLSDNGGPVKSGAVNTPLNGAKGTLLEGGIRTPFIVSWPARLRAGRTFDQPVSSLDIFATVLAAAGIERPAEPVSDSVDLTPCLAGAVRTPPHERLFWRTQGPKAAHAVREGEWKLLRVGDAPPHLFNLAADVGETRDLAGSHPDVVARLTAAIDAWDREMIAPVFPGSSAKNEDWGPGGANRPTDGQPKRQRNKSG